MKKLILLLMIPIFAIGQIQQTFQYTGDPNHFPSLNSFFNTVETSLDSAINDTDLVKTILSYPTPYTIDALDGTLTVNNSPTQSNTNKVVANLLLPSVNEILFKKGDIGRTFIVLGYNNSTSICVVILSWSSGNIFGRVVNYNLSTGVLTNVINSTLTNMTTNQSGSVKIVGDSIEVYKDNVLTLTYDYPTILSLGGFVQNRCLGFGFHAYGSTGTATVTNGKKVVTEAFLKGETIVNHIPIFASINNGQISSNGVWSSSQVFNYTNVNLSELKVVVLGDSHGDDSQAIGACLPEQKWHRVLKSLHGWTTFINSVGGRSLAEVGTEPSICDLSVLNSLDAAFTPDVILLQIGTNDFAGDNVPLGNPTDTVKTTFWGASNFVIPYLKNRYPNSKIIFITPPNLASNLYVNTSDQARFSDGIKFKDYLVAPKTVCAQNGIEVIDFFTFCRELNYNAMIQNNDVSTDKIHLNGNGNYLQALYIERQLRRILEY